MARAVLSIAFTPPLVTQPSWLSRRAGILARECLLACRLEAIVGRALRLPCSSPQGKRCARPTISNRLRHYREGEIVPVAALVIGLEVVAVHSHDRAVGKVGKGADDRIERSVADHGQDQASPQGP